MLIKLKNNSNNYLILLLSLFVIFNFLYREIAYLVLILLILYSLILGFLNGIKLEQNDYVLIFLIIFFATWLWIALFLHESDLRYIDDYMRLVYLLPLYFVFSKININFEDRFIKAIKIAAMCALGHYMYFIATNNEGIFEIQRYGGTSSTAITFAFLSATMLILCFYFFLKNLDKKTDYVLFLSSLIFFLLYSQTETKGLLPGIIICLVLIVYWFKPKKTIIIISLVPLMYIFLSSDISQRVQKTIDFFDVYTSENTNKSLKEIYRSDESTYTRIQLINYGLDTIKNNPYIGLGPQNLEEDLYKKMDYYNMLTTIKFGHLHNDFIDIGVKFGIPSLILLILIYYTLLKNYASRNNKICLLILILFIVGQMTQSHFTHNQAITFFLTLLYCLSGQNSSNKKA